ncbi:hypothetical protein PSI9734_00663 [Pseudidiomarina piscicola]|uniref:Lipoprotein n=1 Tax=Pseudidiomarina piscicola TaxID=2614830 RepID=A0A776EPT5_9GAMM|nr:DUF3833 domain-containing protein [Pseudidiomarina piscicola]CAB0150096.1 hypothetical protein PSI9734_00663 [Pseudidiomarina piscicola]VZT39537.1 hypothetical protein PSI9734_00663 [Pseudomonas aeruginosa]
MKKHMLVIIALTVIILQGCSTSLETYSDEQPHLKLEEFFDGDLVAYGMVQDYSGEVIQRFRVQLEGSWEGNEGVLDETFYYADGSEQKRIWYLTKTAPDQYEGRASDVEGVAYGKVAGNVLNWAYTLTIELDGEPFSVKLDDWLYLVDENNMINRTQMYKYGLNVGEITLYIGKQ